VLVGLEGSGHPPESTACAFDMWGERHNPFTREFVHHLRSVHMQRERGHVEEMIKALEHVLTLDVTPDEKQGRASTPRRLVRCVEESQQQTTAAGVFVRAVAMAETKGAVGLHAERRRYDDGDRQGEVLVFLANLRHQAARVSLLLDGRIPAAGIIDLWAHDALAGRQAIQLESGETRLLLLRPRPYSLQPSPPPSPVPPPCPPPSPAPTLPPASPMIAIPTRPASQARDAHAPLLLPPLSPPRGPEWAPNVRLSPQQLAKSAAASPQAQSPAEPSLGAHVIDGWTSPPMVSTGGGTHAAPDATLEGVRVVGIVLGLSLAIATVGWLRCCARPRRATPRTKEDNLIFLARTKGRRRRTAAPTKQPRRTSTYDRIQTAPDVSDDDSEQDSEDEASMVSMTCEDERRWEATLLEAERSVRASQAKLHVPLSSRGRRSPHQQRESEHRPLQKERKGRGREDRPKSSKDLTFV